MSKELTEQWRNGTLPNGAYYILVDKYEQNEPEIDVGICYNSNFEWWIVKEVLAQVPDYVDYKEFEHTRECLKLSRDKVIRLQEQLNEANKIIKKLYKESGNPIGCDYLEKWGAK